MKNKLSKILSRLDRFARLGVDDTMDFVVQKRIRTINLCIFICLPLITAYWALSYFSQHYLLSYFYLFLISLLLVMLLFNYLKKGESFRIGVLIVLVLSMSVGSILFNNGQEFYVLLIALLSILFYDLRKKQLYLSIGYAVSYIIIEVIASFIKPIEQAPAYIKVVNIIVVLFILFYFLYDIKKIYLNFLQENIDEKQNLKASNSLLVQQAVSLELKNKNIEDLKNRNEELSSIVYHQLRSPVATFSSILTQFLESSDYYTKEEFKEMAEAISKKVTGTLSVVDNVLKWNSKGVDSIEAHALECDVNSIMQKVLSQLEPQVEKKILNIRYIKPRHTTVYADSDHILIILQNILTNAIKFSPLNGNINIEIPDSTEVCKVSISNNGKGIPKERLKSLFSNHQIISAAGTMNETGTGFGLKICKKLVEKNKGTIRIESEENKKTTVIIELPMKH